MDFAQFITSHSRIDPRVLNELNTKREKIGDFLINKEVLTKEDLIELLEDYAKQESSDQ